MKKLLLPLLLVVAAAGAANAQIGISVQIGPSYPYRPYYRRPLPPPVYYAPPPPPAYYYEPRPYRTYYAPPQRYWAPPGHMKKYYRRGYDRCDRYERRGRWD